MYGDDYEERLYRIQRDKKKKIREAELTSEEVVKRGQDLLKKIVNVIPKQPAKRKADELTVSIKLKPHPKEVVNFVKKAFRLKGFTAKHQFSDGLYDSYDRLVLTFPKDWLMRILLLGDYKPS